MLLNGSSVKYFKLKRVISFTLLPTQINMRAMKKTGIDAPTTTISGMPVFTPGGGIIV